MKVWQLNTILASIWLAPSTNEYLVVVFSMVFISLTVITAIKNI